jgi:hypothetical protein
MAKLLVGQWFRSYNGTAALTDYAGPSMIHASSVSTTEATARTTHRSSNITVSNWRLYAISNARTTASTFTWMKGGVAQSLAISIGAGVTGVVEDTTNTVSLTAGDTHSVRGVFGAEASGLNISVVGQYQVETASASSVQLLQSLVAGTTNAASVRQGRFAGLMAATTSLFGAHDWQVAGTFTGVHGYVSANTLNGTTTMAIRKNGVNAITASVTAGTTGRFENSASTTAAAVGDDIFAYMSTAGSSGAITLGQIGTHFTPTTAGEFHVPFNHLAFSTATAGVSGWLQNTSTTGLWTQYSAKATTGLTLSRFTINATSNATTATSTGVSFINGADGNQTISITAGSTGVFQDTVNTDSLASGARFAAKITNGSAHASNFSPDFKAAEVNSITGDASITDADDTVTADGALAIQAAASITDATDTVSGAGTLPIAAAASITDATDTVSGAGALPIVGAASITDATDTITATGALAIQAAASITDATDTITATGALAIQAAASITDATDTVTASGSGPAGAVVGDASVTDATDTTTATGALAIVGAASITDDTDTISATSVLPIVGAASVSDATDTLSAAAVLAIVANASITDSDDFISDTDASDGGSLASLLIRANASINDGNDTISAYGSELGQTLGAANLFDEDDTISATGTPDLNYLDAIRAGAIQLYVPARNNLFVPPAGWPSLRSERRPGSFPVQRSNYHYRSGG